jgi:hypothetical protein
MHRQPLVQCLAVTLALAAGLASAGCSREAETPAAEVQSRTPAQQSNQPVTVRGCLRAGEATDTFVLTASRAENQQEQTATYQLVGREGVDFKSNVGRQVEVSGIVNTEQRIANRSAISPADGKATGTAGTPTVQTTTTVDMKQLDVTALRALAEQCEG